MKECYHCGEMFPASDITVYDGMRCCEECRDIMIADDIDYQDALEEDAECPGAPTSSAATNPAG